jgi:branched-chain amino acid transport system substrate-binding protein
MRSSGPFVLALAVSSIACGTRVPDDTIGGNRAGSVAVSSPAPQASIPSTMPAQAAPSATLDRPAQPQPGRPAGALSKAPHGGRRSAPRGENGPLEDGVTTTSTRSAPAVGGGREAESNAENGALPPPGSAVVVASVGTYSGPAGAVLVPMVQGAQVWVQWINQKGGLNGHQVRMIVFDDGGDPARHQAQVKEAVERHRVIAFLINGDSATGQASLNYIREKQVPVVGSDLGSEWAYTNPMYFPQGSAGDAFHFSNIAMAAEEMVGQGKTKLATLTCSEVQACGDAERIFTRTAPGLGFQHVYRARASLVQPDFTAECLSARKAGAQVFIVFLDSNSVGRLAASCARQDYRPVYSVPQAIQTARQADDPNVEGMLVNTGVFPYFQAATPATDEYQQAMSTSGSKVPNGVGPAVGWTAGKLLETAAAHLPEPPTSAALLHGLWSIRDDTLGGLTHPLTFREGQTAPRRACWFTLLIRSGAWVSPDGYRLHCAAIPG